MHRLLQVGYNRHDRRECHHLRACRALDSARHPRGPAPLGCASNQPPVDLRHAVLVGVLLHSLHGRHGSLDHRQAREPLGVGGVQELVPCPCDESVLIASLLVRIGRKDHVAIGNLIKHHTDGPGGVPDCIHKKRLLVRSLGILRILIAETSNINHCLVPHFEFLGDNYQYLVSPDCPCWPDRFGLVQPLLRGNVKNVACAMNHIDTRSRVTPLIVRIRPADIVVQRSGLDLHRAQEKILGTY
mmetsp:Transcript_11504/g.25560  ORF Transcript_11504/g.25560 Transcript_11504/m.25560 type:complete len:243 (+) Transcript_11504:943-1671(+)